MATVEGEEHVVHRVLFSLTAACTALMASHEDWYADRPGANTNKGGGGYIGHGNGN